MKIITLLFSTIVLSAAAYSQTGPMMPRMHIHHNNKLIGYITENGTFVAGLFARTSGADSAEIVKGLTEMVVYLLNERDQKEEDCRQLAAKIGQEMYIKGTKETWEHLRKKTSKVLVK